VLETGRLGHLLRGQRPEHVGRILGGVFALCSHAHRLAAELALGMARNNTLVASDDERSVLLWIETARDHLRSIALDWPQRLPEKLVGTHAMDWLRGCPLPLGMAHPFKDAEMAWKALTQLRDWLEAHILGQSVGDWLSMHSDPVAQLTWCNAQSLRLMPATCLSIWHAMPTVWVPETRALTVLDRDPARQRVQLQQFAQAWIQQSDFAQYPTWLGSCAENGPWARLRHRQHTVSPRYALWRRLSARWLELIEITNASRQNSTAHDEPLLTSGAMSLSDGQALAWCEMARGLLFHWVQLDTQGLVQDYRVVAPTEWNFHPGGALALAVAALASDQAHMAQVLAAAFDPCVTCTVRYP
jgi:hypothetical protein